MRRGLVLPFPSPQRLTPDDCESLQRFAAAFPDAQIDIIIGRDRREIAIVACDKRQLWISRNESRVLVRNAAGGQHLAPEISMDDILTALKAGLLDGQMPGRSIASKLAVGQSIMALAGK
ncbi:hypothetical protein E2C06_33915 [Dankookia rubra]|uniref:Uncharacterized protein n=1 Tax=Dankookia rubra TaxID=1442381 RepID=A0A4R5Q7F0_9PROT|nr:hypothetical protein [Dankookia rubra]TDH58191.1 hypothetical protein E2C06_33915 [Dankookia rubra]